MKISKIKKDKIAEQILIYLYQVFPHYPFTAEIAQEIARDEEFVKKLLIDLKDKNFVLDIKKNQKGDTFSRRIKWRLTNKVYELFHLKNKNLLL